MSSFSRQCGLAWVGVWHSVVSRGLVSGTVSLCHKRRNGATSHTGLAVLLGIGAEATLTEMFCMPVACRYERAYTENSLDLAFDSMYKEKAKGSQRDMDKARRRVEVRENNKKVRAYFGGFRGFGFVFVLSSFSFFYGVH